MLLGLYLDSLIPDIVVEHRLQVVVFSSLLLPIRYLVSKLSDQCRLCLFASPWPRNSLKGKCSLKPDISYFGQKLKKNLNLFSF